MHRLAHIADLHFDERHDIEDLVRVLRAFLSDAADACVEGIIIAGDVFERRSSPTERWAFAQFLEEALTLGMPCCVIGGNHDQDLDLAVFGFIHGVTISDMPSWAGLCLGGRFRVMTLPWFTKEYVLAKSRAGATKDETREATIAAAQELLAQYRASAKSIRAAGKIPILAAHVQVAGSEVSTGQTLIGQSVEIAPHDLLDVGAEYVALGHVHKHQTWFDGRVAYSGSPQRQNFGEPEEKGWRLVTFTDDGRYYSSEFRPLPARRIVLLELTPAQQGTVVSTEDLSGALVRIRIRAPAKDLASVDRSALEKMAMRAGAKDVTVEVVVQHETRQRAPEIVSAVGTAEKVEAWIRAKGLGCDDEQLARLRKKVGELEGGEDAACGA